jgi:MATE family multidrug resistance protein
VWGIGLPIGCYLAYERDMEVAGLWAGLAIGLTFLAFFLGVYLKKMMKLLAIK